MSSPFLSSRVSAMQRASSSGSKREGSSLLWTKQRAGRKRMVDRPAGLQIAAKQGDRFEKTGGTRLNPGGSHYFANTLEVGQPGFAAHARQGEVGLEFTLLGRIP